MDSSFYESLTDALTLVALLGFPAYAVYWFRYHLGAERRSRLWIGIAAFLAWCVATYVCFLRLMLGCLGGNCAGKVSPFLEFAILYAVSAAGLIVWMHRSRAPYAG